MLNLPPDRKTTNNIVCDMQFIYDTARLQTSQKAFSTQKLLLEVYSLYISTNHWAIKEANRVARRQCSLYPCQVVLGMSLRVATKLRLNGVQERQGEQGRGCPLWSTLQPALIHQGVTERHYLPEKRKRAYVMKHTATLTLCLLDQSKSRFYSSQVYDYVYCIISDKDYRNIQCYLFM